MSRALAPLLLLLLVLLFITSLTPILVSSFVATKSIVSCMNNTAQEEGQHQRFWSCCMENLQKAVALVVILFTCWYPIVLKLVQLLRGSRTSNSNKAPGPTLKMEEYFTRRQQPNEKTFPQFRELGEDIMMHILAFVADAPFEDAAGGVENCMSSLTHSLPCVSKQFHRLVTNNESYWKAALIRQAKREPKLWRQGLENQLPTTTASDEDADKDEPETVSQLLERLPGTPCWELYRNVLNNEIRQKKPIFGMRQSLKLGEPYGLHFFEPRYRMLIAEVMREFPDEAKRGEPIVRAPGQKPPTFIHAHIHPLQRGTPACLVEVMRCRIYPEDGRADVFLVPVQHVLMEQMWERPGAGHLYYGQCLQVGQDESERLGRAAAEPQIFGW